MVTGPLEDDCDEPDVEEDFDEDEEDEELFELVERAACVGAAVGVCSSESESVAPSSLVLGATALWVGDAVAAGELVAAAAALCAGAFASRPMPNTVASAVPAAVIVPVVRATLRWPCSRAAARRALSIVVPLPLRDCLHCASQLLEDSESGLRTPGALRSSRIREDAGMQEEAGPAARILLVEDDAALREMLLRLLVEEGYQVEPAPDGQRGLHLGLTYEFDLLVLDRNLPGMDGLELLARLRSRGVTVPALVLSALGNPSDRVEGLDAGAEDYLTKPFDIDELLARLRALLRRHQDTARKILLPGGSLDLDSRQVLRVAPGSPGDAVQLSERECTLLATLAARPGQVFTRAQLMSWVFEGADSDVVVDTYVHYLRRKLGRGAIRTVRGLGYQLGRL